MKRKRNDAREVGSTEWLCPFMVCEPNGNISLVLHPEGYSNQNRKVSDKHYRLFLSVIQSAKANNSWVDIPDLSHNEIKCFDDGSVAFRGRALDSFDLLSECFHEFVRSLPRRVMRFGRRAHLHNAKGEL